MVERRSPDGERESGQTLPPAGAAFLLAQLGAHAAARFADLTAALDLTPGQAGLLRLVAREPGRSQHAVAQELGVAPSRVVALVDDLQDRNLIERRRSASDRRNYALHLTEPGTRVLGQIRTIAVEHEQTITSALGVDERLLLTDLLQRIADQQGLRPGVHPGYRRLPVPARADRSAIG